MIIGQQPIPSTKQHNRDPTNGLSTTKFVILALLIVGMAIIICLAMYIIKNKIVVKSLGTIYTHCSRKPINHPHRKAFNTLGIKFISPDKIFNLAQQPRPHKIIYIPCSYNNSDLDIQNFFRGKRLSYGGNQAQWLTAAVLGCNKLCSKNGLWSVLETTYGRQKAAQITPESWVIPAEKSIIRRLIHKQETHEIHPLTLIFKKNIQGKQGLLLTNSPAEIRKLISSNSGPNNNYCVAQKYIEQPYLIHGRKLNIRLYVLVVLSAVGSFWWLYRSGKCIYTNRQYEPLPPETTIRSGSENQKDLLEQHFTSLNLNSQKAYQEEQCPETLDELQKYMLFRGEDWPQIWEKIQLGLQKVAWAYTGKLITYPNSEGYQIFGVDYILTRSAEDVGTDIMPYLLEFNKGPEMKYKSPRDPELKQGLQKDILELVLGQQSQTDKWLLLNSVNKSKTSKF